MHHSHLDEFTRFLLSCGYELQKPKQYEVLRATRPGESGALIVWCKVNAKEHFTIQGESRVMFEEWFSNR